MNVTPKRTRHRSGRRAGSTTGCRSRPAIPTPFEDAANFWRATAQAATIVMCVLMLGVLLYLARALILPLLCAFAVGLTLGPLIKVAERRGIPPWLMAIMLVVLLIAAANLAIVMLAGPVSALIAQAPEIGAAFAEKLHIFDRPLAALDELQTALGIDAPTSRSSFNPARDHRRHRDHRHAGRAAVHPRGRCCSSPRCSSSSWAAPASAITP